MSLRLSTWLVICNVFVCSTLVLASLQSLNDSREADKAVARQTAVNLANSLSLEIAAEIRLISNALETVALDVAQADSDTERRVAVAQSVVEQSGLLPHVASLRYADVDGSSPNIERQLDQPISISHRVYFDAAKQSAAMVISEPLLDMENDRWSIILARRLLTQDGDFFGVVYAVITAEHFVNRFAQLDMGDSGAIALRTDTLRLVARRAGTDATAMKGVGEVVVSQEMVHKLTENSNHGWYITHAAVDNVERVVAYQRVGNYPLLVFTGLATQEFLVSWRRDVVRQSILVIFIVTVTAGISTYLYIRQRRERRKRDQADQIAREQGLLLENDLVGMIRARDRVNVWENKAANRIFGYETGELNGQSTRMLYLDEETYDKIGDAYAQLQRDGRFSDQIQMRRKDGQPIWIDLSGAYLSPHESLWMMVDIDAIKRSEALAKNMALRDPLTGLANRRLLDVQLENAVAMAWRNITSIAVCYLDLDGFKQINDVHGHGAGDEVLRATGRRLLASVRDTDAVSRLGGDEFAVVLSPVKDLKEAIEVMTRCLGRIREGIHLDSGAIVYVDSSMGIVMGNGSSTPTALLRSADEAMYAAKRAGKGRIHAAERGEAPTEVSSPSRGD